MINLEVINRKRPTPSTHAILFIKKVYNISMRIMSISSISLFKHAPLSLRRSFGESIVHRVSGFPTHVRFVASSRSMVLFRIFSSLFYILSIPVLTLLSRLLRIVPIINFSKSAVFLTNSRGILFLPFAGLLNQKMPVYLVVFLPISHSTFNAMAANRISFSDMTILAWNTSEVAFQSVGDSGLAWNDHKKHTNMDYLFSQPVKVGVVG